MARPIKQGIDYFPLDVDFFDDDKIQLIESEFASKGAYIAVRLMCKIYKENGYYYQWGKDQCALFAKNIGAGFTPASVHEIVLRLVKRSFFDERLFNTFQILTSKGIQARYFAVVKSSKIKRQSVDERYDLLQDTEQSEKTSEQSTQRKVKETKLKESREKKEAPHKKPLKIAVLNLNECKQQLATDTAWAKCLCINLQIDELRLESYLNQFFQKLENEGISTKQQKDAKQHFYNWLRIELDKETEKQKGGKNADRESMFCGVQY